MRAVIQRVSSASVSISGEECASIGRGLLILLGVTHGDGEKECDYLAAKCAGLRIFRDQEEKMNLSVSDIGGAVLVVSQFTLYSDCRKGRRPAFVDAAPPAERADSRAARYCPGSAPPRPSGRSCGPPPRPIPPSSCTSSLWSGCGRRGYRWKPAALGRICRFHFSTTAR